MRSRCMVLLSVAVALCSFPTLAQQSDVSAAATAGKGAEGASRSLAVQGGWWNWEVEWKSRTGVYGALGVPVPLAVMNHLGGDAKWTVPFGMRVGYQHETWARLKLRGAVHVAGAYSSERNCDCDDGRTTRSYFLAELGVRYEGPSGFVAGLDVPVVAFDDVHESVRGKNDGVEIFLPPIAFVFSQVYVGYAWR